MKQSLVVSGNDYYPGGMLMPGRNFNSSLYRYKHQGQESDPEIYGEGNSYNYTFRMSDPRIIRFWSVDPLASSYPGWSPYAFSQNRLIDAVEFEGLEAHLLNQDDKGGFSLTYDWNAAPLDDPTSQVYFKGQVASISDLSSQYDIGLFNPTAYPTDKIGDEGYYKFRHEDLSIRAGLAGKSVPDDQYYLDYGDVNIRLFKGETYSKVSASGKSFINQAAKNLQYPIESRLKQPGAAEYELSGDFKSFAFGTHVDAYKKAGFLGLDFLDKTYIGLTPPLRHITSDEGIQQVRNMMSLQMHYYKDNPDILGIHLFKYQYQKPLIKKAIIEKGVKELLDNK